MSGNALSGGRQCSVMPFPATPQKPNLAASPCAMCRRGTGGPWLAVSCGADVTVANDESLGVYVSSQRGERRFCKKCGGTLFSRLRDQSSINVSAKAFDDPAQFKFVEEIIIDEKPENYPFANETHKMAGAEVIAAFNASRE